MQFPKKKQNLQYASLREKNLHMKLFFTYIKLYSLLLTSVRQNNILSCKSYMDSTQSFSPFDELYHTNLHAFRTSVEVEYMDTDIDGMI